MAFRFVTSNPALAPLFAAVGAGVFGATIFGVHVLRSNPDVMVARTANPEPWNQIQQHENKKLFSPNTTFWSNRVGVPDPRAAFMDTNSTTNGGLAKAKAKVQEAKAKMQEKH